MLDRVGEEKGTKRGRENCSSRGMRPKAGGIPSIGSQSPSPTPRQQRAYDGGGGVVLAYFGLFG